MLVYFGAHFTIFFGLCLIAFAIRHFTKAHEEEGLDLSGSIFWDLVTPFLIKCPFGMPKLFFRLALAVDSLLFCIIRK